MKYKQIMTVGALGILAVFGYTMAYFSGTDALTNRMTTGNVEIELIESKYDDLSTDDKKLNTGDTANKDPLVKNTGRNPAYVFLKVTIPSADVRILKNVDNITEADKVFYTLEKDKELYQWEYNNTVGAINDGAWTKMTRLDDHTYLFAYTGGGTTMKVLGVNEKTGVLFDQVQFIENLYAWKDKEILELYAYEYSQLTTAAEKTAYWNQHGAWITSNDNDAKLDSQDAFEALAAKAQNVSGKYGKYIQNDTLHVQVDAIAVQSESITVSEKTPENVWEFLQGL